MKNWKIIPKYTKYEISDHGEVRSIETGKIKKHDWAGRDRLRYKSIHLIEDGKTYRTGKKHLLIHKLVYEVFKGEVPEDYQVDHIDRDNLNNQVQNLRAVPRKENQDNREWNTPVEDFSVFCEMMYD